MDQLSFSYNAGRINGDQKELIIFKAVYDDEIRKLAIPLTIYEDIPDPDFTLSAPVMWNGRDTIEVSPFIENLEQLTDSEVSELSYEWKVSNIAVTKELADNKLILTRAQNSGLLLINLTVNNGGSPISQTIAIKVIEPADDKWLRRMPGELEKPLDKQFYAREDDNFGTIYYKGRVRERADSVILRVFADDELYLEIKQKPGKRRSYSFEARIEAGLVLYSTELWIQKPKEDKLLDRSINLICGDAYIVDGQSNAEAYDNGRAVNPYSSNWVRSYGSSSSDPEKSSLDSWGRAVSFDKGEAKFQIGYWGIELAKNIVMRHKIPVCIINGAVGGSRIDQHQKNDLFPEDPNTIYGRMLRRVNEAGLSHGIRGVIWHQGENDQGAAGPDDGYGWETYQQYFIDMSASWKEDYPNIQQYYIYQIWPDA